MSNNAQPDWLNQEDNRAESLKKSGKEASNPTAPRLVKKRKSRKLPDVKRVTKGFLIRLDYHQFFDQLVVEQKHTSGKNGPALAEEALELLFKRYGKELP